MDNRRRDLLVRGAAALGALGTGAAFGAVPAVAMSGRGAGETNAQAASPRWFNVKAFGAVGDGSANDTQPIQAAVDAANQAGGVVYFPTSTYHLADELTLRDLTAVRFIGDGASSVLRPRAGNSFVSLNFFSARNIEIASLAFHGDERRGSAAIRAEDVDGFDVHHCTVHEGNTGIRVLVSAKDKESRNIRIMDNTITDLTGAGVGILCGPGCRDILIAGNIVDGVGEEGIAIDGSGFEGFPKPHSAVIVGNRVSNSGRVGVGVYWADRCTISANRVTDTADGFAGIGVSTDVDYVMNEDVTVSGNVVERCGEDGIRIRDTVGFAVTGNVVRDVRDGDGIGLGGAGGAHHGVVSANTIRESGGSYFKAGIRFRGGVGAAITGNYVDQGERPGVFGILVHADAERCTVTGNVVERAAAGGIKVDGTACIVSANHVPEGANGLVVTGPRCVSSANASMSGEITAG